MEQTGHVGIIHTFSLFIALFLCTAGVSIRIPWTRCQPLILSLITIYSHLPLQRHQKTYCSGLGFIMWRGDADGGWEGGHIQYMNLARVERWSLGWEEAWTSLYDWAKRRENVMWRQQRLWLYCTAEMPMHAVNIWTIRVCIKVDVVWIYNAYVTFNSSTYAFTT